jgi:hypothetical protein
MTEGVRQAAVQLPTGKPNADRPGVRSRGTDQGFGDALRFARTGKQPVTRSELPGKPAANDLPPRWLQFETRLDAAIDGTGLAQALIAVAKQNQPATAGSESDLDDSQAESETHGDPSGAEAGSEPTFSATQSFCFPPFDHRRLPRKEGQEPTDKPHGTDRPKPVDTNRNAGKEGETVEGGEPALEVILASKPVSQEDVAKPRFLTRPGEAVPAEVALSATAEPRHRDAPRATPRATIMAEQTIPAPMSTTATLVTEQITGDGSFLRALDRPSTHTVQPQSVALPAQSLKIELHPAELGVVTASLRFVGDQLSIELKVETHEAHRRLSTDSEAIVSSLRGLGYDIDKVTVIQPQLAVSGPGRADANGAISGQAPRGGEFGSGAAGGENAGTGGQRAGGEGGNARQNGHKPAPGQGDGAGGSLYI